MIREPVVRKNIVATRIFRLCYSKISSLPRQDLQLNWYAHGSLEPRNQNSNLLPVSLFETTVTTAVASNASAFTISSYLSTSMVPSSEACLRSNMMALWLPSIISRTVSICQISEPEGNWFTLRRLWTTTVWSEREVTNHNTTLEPCQVQILGPFWDHFFVFSSYSTGNISLFCATLKGLLSGPRYRQSF